jgi:hypothetical protein
VKDNSKLFENILLDFQKTGILENVILIGSWVLPIYRHYFSNTPEIPILRTTDIDFLISNPPKINIQADIPSLLERHGFIEQHSVIDNFTKFIHPDLEIEFLIPELGRGRKTAVSIKELNITAQPLRYLSFYNDDYIQRY